MASGSIRGITIEFDSNTSKLTKGIKSVESQSTGLQKQINAINKSLKFDSGNTELTAQKMTLLQNAAASAATEVEELKNIQGQMDAAGLEKSSAAYRKIEQEIAILESKTKEYKSQYEQAMDSAPVETLKRQYQLLQEDIQASDNEVKKLENQQAQMKASGVQETDAQYVALSQKIEAAKAKNTALKESLNQLGENISAKEAAEEVEDLGDALEETSEQAEETGESMGEISDGMETVSAAMAGAGLVQLTKEFAQALGDCVSTAASFDTAMSQVAATMGVSVQSISNMSETAKEMGASTQFSATESAEALNYLALAGYDSEKAIDTLPTVLNLAAAGSMDLASASDMVTDAMSALGLETSEADTFVDQMAKTASSSNTSVAQLGEALLTIGATGKTVAGGTTELNTELGLLANVGLKGAEAGTHLRNILLSLQSPTDDAAARLGELTTGVYDAQGNMRNLADIFSELQDSMEGWSQDAKDAAISDIFNKTDLAAAKALLSSTGEAWDSLTESISDSGGAAADMAETQMDNLNGSLTELSSATEGLKIAIGEQFSPALETAADGATKLVGGLTGLVEENGGLAVAATGAASALGLMVTAVTALTAAQKIYKALDMATAFTKLATPVGLVTTAVSALAAGITVAISDWKNIQEVQEAAANNVTVAQDAYEETAASLAADQDEVAALCARLDELTSSTSASASEQAEAKAIVDELNEMMPDLGLSYDEATNAINMNTDAIVENARAMAAQEEIEALQEIITAATKDQIDAETELTGQEEDLAAAKQELADAQQAYNDAVARGEKDLLGYQEDINDAQADVDFYNGQVERTQGYIDDLQGTIDETTEQIDQYTTSTDDAADSNGDLADSAEETAGAMEEEAEAEVAANESLKDIAKELQNASGSGDELMELYEELEKEYEGLDGAGDEWRSNIVKQSLEQLKLVASTKQLQEQLPLLQSSYEGVAAAIEATGYSVDDFVASYNEAFDTLISGFDTLEFGSGSLQEWINSMNARTQIQTVWNDNMSYLTECVTDASTHPYLSASPEMEAAVQELMDGGVETYGLAASELVEAIKSGDTETVSAILSSVHAASTAAENAAITEFSQATGVTEAQLRSLIDSGAATVENGQYVITDAAKAMAAGVPEGIAEGTSDATGAVDAMVNTAGAAALSDTAVTAFTYAGEAFDQYVGDGISNMSSVIESAMQDAIVLSAGTAKTVAQHQGHMVGRYFDMGLAQGITDYSGLITTAANNAAKAAYDSACASLEIGSPSKKMKEVGKFFAEGMAIGIGNGSSLVSQAAKAMAKGATASAATTTAAAVTNNNATYGGNTYTINVNGAGQSAQTIAQTVMNEIRRTLVRA